MKFFMGELEYSKILLLEKEIKYAKKNSFGKNPQYRYCRAY